MSIVSVIKSQVGVSANVRATPGDIVFGRVYKAATAELKFFYLGARVKETAPEPVQQMLKTLEVNQLEVRVDVDVQMSKPDPDFIKELRERNYQRSLSDPRFSYYDTACAHYNENPGLGSKSTPLCCMQVHEVQIERVSLVALYNAFITKESQHHTKVVRVLREDDFGNSEIAQLIRWIKQEVARKMMEEMRVVHEGYVACDNPNSDLLVAHRTRIVDAEGNVLATYIPTPRLVAPKPEPQCAAAADVKQEVKQEEVKQEAEDESERDAEETVKQEAEDEGERGSKRDADEAVDDGERPAKRARPPTSD